MIQTLKDIKETMELHDKRRKERGHDGLTEADLEAIRKLQEAGERVRAKTAAGFYDRPLKPPRKS